MLGIGLTGRVVPNQLILSIFATNFSFNGSPEKASTIKNFIYCYMIITTRGLESSLQIELTTKHVFNTHPALYE